jgi:hypothetical protein
LRIFFLNLEGAISWLAGADVRHDMALVQFDTGVTDLWSRTRAASAVLSIITRLQSAQLGHVGAITETMAVFSLLYETRPWWLKWGFAYLS